MNAKLVPCPDCEREVSLAAVACPQCGRLMHEKPKKQSMFNRWRVMTASVIIAGAIAQLIHLNEFEEVFQVGAFLCVVRLGFELDATLHHWWSGGH